MEHQAITQLVGIAANTLQSYLREEQSGGIEPLKELRFYRPSSALTPHAQSLEEHFRKHPPISINAAIATLETLTGIHRSPTQVRLFLKRLGHETFEGWGLSSQSSPEVQETFRLEKLEPRIKEAQAGKQAIFCRCSAFCQGAFLGFLWCFERLFVKAPWGRKRFDVLAALNAITPEVITVTNDSYINALSG